MRPLNRTHKTNQFKATVFTAILFCFFTHYAIAQKGKKEITSLVPYKTIVLENHSPDNSTAQKNTIGTAIGRQYGKTYVFDSAMTTMYQQITDTLFYEYNLTGEQKDKMGHYIDGYGISLGGDGKTNLPYGIFTNYSDKVSKKDSSTWKFTIVIRDMTTGDIISSYRIPFFTNGMNNYYSDFAVIRTEKGLGTILITQTYNPQLKTTRFCGWSNQVWNTKPSEAIKYSVNNAFLKDSFQININEVLNKALVDIDPASTVPLWEFSEPTGTNKYTSIYSFQTAMDGSRQALSMSSQSGFAFKTWNKKTGKWESSSGGFANKECLMTNSGKLIDVSYPITKRKKADEWKHVILEKDLESGNTAEKILLDDNALYSSAIISNDGSKIMVPVYEKDKSGKVTDNYDLVYNMSDGEKLFKIELPTIESRGYTLRQGNLRTLSGEIGSTTDYYKMKDFVFSADGKRVAVIAELCNYVALDDQYATDKLTYTRIFRHFVDIYDLPAVQ